MADDIIGSVTDPGITSAPAPSESIPVSPGSAGAPESGIIGSIHDQGIQTSEDHYGTPGQQILSGLEGAAQGVIGPLAPALEQATGLTTGADIRGRQEANPVTHGASEAAGFLGSLFVPGIKGVGLAAQVGNIGEHAAALVPEVSRIVATGVKAGAEMTALASSTELSKMVEGDPEQTLGSAAINVGLSGVIGGIGGAAIGSVSPLWNKTKNIIGVNKLAADFMGETKALQEVADPIISATNELKGRINEADNMWKVMGETKPEVLQKAMPAPTAENISKVDGQIQDIYDHVNGALKKADQSIKTKSAVPFIAEDLSNFQDAVTAPNATLADKFVATNKLKTTLEGYAKWGLTEEGSAKAALGRALSNFVRPALEDTKIWGAAGDVQKVTNEAISNMIAATKDIRGQVTSKLLGEAEVAPEKVQTLINQANAGKLGRKASVVANYLEATEKYADAINRVHLDNGLEAPLASQLNPTPVINHALNTEITPGVALARWANKKGASVLANSAGEAGASVVGGGLGALVGHPLLGAWAGEKILGPMFSALAKPLAETAVDSAAARGAVDYIGNAIKGQKLLSDSVSNLFSKGAEVISKDLIPDQESRNKLEKSLVSFQNPTNATKVAGSLGHYLPSHATAAAQVASVSANYLNSLKPTQPVNNPLDATPPVDKSAQYKYNRALDIAQQPLMVLKHVKSGTLLPDDVKTINTIYPGLSGKISQLVTNELIKTKTDQKSIPYSQRVSLNLLMNGNPLDGTMTPFAAQTIMHTSNQQAPQSQGPSPAAKTRQPSSATLNQLNKVSSLYQTPLQARATNKNK